MSGNEKRGFWRATGEYLGLIEPTVSTPSEQRAASAAVMPPVRPTYSDLTPETALEIGAVYRAIQIIVTAVSSMNLTVFRGGKEIKTLPALVRNPNVNDSQSAFIEETVFSLAAHGNAYWRIYRSNGAVVSLEVLDPSTVGIRWEKNKKVYYIGTQDFKADEIKHLKLMRKPGADFGFGPIQQGTKELQAALRLKQFADQWYDIAGIPSGILTTDAVLNPDEAAGFADAWKKFLQTHGGTAVLSQGLRYEHLHIKPADAQYIEVQKATIINIARLFGIPAGDLLAEMGGTSLTYQNIEQANMTFLQKTLARYMNEIENALSDMLPRGQVVQFNEETLLRMDTKTKVEVQAAQIAAGLRSADELRAEDGLEPLPKPDPAPVVEQATQPKKEVIE